MLTLELPGQWHTSTVATLNNDVNTAVIFLKIKPCEMPLNHLLPCGKGSSKTQTWGRLWRQTSMCTSIAGFICYSVCVTDLGDCLSHTSPLPCFVYLWGSWACRAVSSLVSTRYIRENLLQLVSHEDVLQQPIWYWWTYDINQTIIFIFFIIIPITGG